jgi:hypothetical protein
MLANVPFPLAGTAYKADSLQTELPARWKNSRHCVAAGAGPGTMDGKRLQWFVPQGRRFHHTRGLSVHMRFALLESLAAYS